MPLKVTHPHAAQLPPHAFPVPLLLPPPLPYPPPPISSSAPLSACQALQSLSSGCRSAWGWGPTISARPPPPPNTTGYPWDGTVGGTPRGRGPSASLGAAHPLGSLTQ